MSTLFEQIANDVLKKENESIKERNVGHAKEIRIHPEQFFELMTDPKLFSYVSDPREVTFMGIPLVRDPEVDKWKVVM